jgi:hypothetical protein
MTRMGSEDSQGTGVEFNWETRTLCNRPHHPCTILVLLTDKATSDINERRDVSFIARIGLGSGGQHRTKKEWETILDIFT